MSDIVIKAENLGKSYIIGHEKQERYTALRDVLANKVKGIASKTRQIFKGGQLIAGDELEEFWALKDLHFEIKQGERVGIIGRNGAGKSTLLKVLSRITEPTTGRVTIRGRVASLLEVGTGFHPELTGRENIYLNGAILGMGRVEIKKKFDEIVDFSGVEKFLDTPVKRYSSGMYVRLAFAVAAHLEPEILVVDEVLAVGDAEFQKKCLGKMEDVSTKEGRTVLFVSHNMQAIRNLCTDSILLENGNIISIGKSNKVIEEYIQNSNTISSIQELSDIINELPRDNTYKLEGVNIIQEGLEIFNNISNGSDCEINITYQLFQQITAFRVFIDLYDGVGDVVLRSFHDELTEGIISMNPGTYVSKVIIPKNLLAPITYDLKILFGIHNIRMLPPIEGINIKLTVTQTGIYNNAYSGQYTAGKICPSLKWDINKIL
jgi:lipopolysaccharide transport system ATP-binding protein